MKTNAILNSLTPERKRELFQAITRGEITPEDIRSGAWLRYDANPPEVWAVRLHLGNGRNVYKIDAQDVTQERYERATRNTSPTWNVTLNLKQPHQ